MVRSCVFPEKRSCSWFTLGERVSIRFLKRKIDTLMVLPCVFPDRLNETDFLYIRNRPKHGKNFATHWGKLLLKESMRYNYCPYWIRWCISLIQSACVSSLDQHIPTSARQSAMSERSGGTPPYHSSPRPSLSHSHPRLSLYHSHTTLPQEGERLSFTLDDTFRELDEFQEDPPLFLEEGSWEGEESEHSDPTLTLLNSEHFQVSRETV